MKINPIPHKWYKYVSHTSLPHFSQLNLSQKKKHKSQNKLKKTEGFYSLFFFFGSILFDKIYLLPNLSDFSIGYIA